MANMPKSYSEKINPEESLEELTKIMESLKLK